MNLCIDIGNSRIKFSVFRNCSAFSRVFIIPLLSLNLESKLFVEHFNSIISECKIDRSDIKNIVISSVVPRIESFINNACLEYFNKVPQYLNDKSQKIIKINYKGNPGADRIASAIGVVKLFPNQDVFIIGFGTATTVCFLDKSRNYNGIAILPSVDMSANVLHEMTALLPLVDADEITQNVIEFDNINKHEKMNIIEGSTISNILNGIYYTQIGAVMEIIKHAKKYSDGNSIIITTGGRACMFNDAIKCNHTIDNLCLIGLNHFAQTI